MHLTLGLWDIRDTQCGFKFFRGPVARDLFRRQRVDGYMFDVEIMHLAERAGYRIKEVGVRWRDDADSRLDLVSGNWRNMIDILRIRFSDYGPPRTAADARTAETELGHRPVEDGDTP
jgi:dolichyl-phosphate beta-glucosyltransferase